MTKERSTKIAILMTPWTEVPLLALEDRGQGFCINFIKFINMQHLECYCINCFPLPLLIFIYSVICLLICKSILTRSQCRIFDTQVTSQARWPLVNSYLISYLHVIVEHSLPFQHNYENLKHLDVYKIRAHVRRTIIIYFIR